MAYIPTLQTDTPIIEFFYNQTVSIVQYPWQVKQVLGRVPNVQVFYWDKVTYEYVTGNLPSSRVVFTGGTIEVDHGGPETGIIKVS